MMKSTQFSLSWILHYHHLLNERAYCSVFALKINKIKRIFNNNLSFIPIQIQ
jgi:hypothetical protein